MLPVVGVEGLIVESLKAAGRLVLAAPTGSGKTTQVPQILLRHAEELGISGRIVVLQPRRLATRMVAKRVAEEMGVELGGGVGFQTRHERCVGPESRIVFMTEGLLLRRLQDEPTLPGVGAVILDEFHERSVTADLCLGLLRSLQQGSRRDLKLVVMSATLDTQGVAAYFNAEVVEAQGRAYPVAVTYLPRPAVEPCWDLAAAAVESVVERIDAGHVLVFMPGVYEINRTIEACRRRLGARASEFAVLPLHGSLPPREQDAAVSSGRGIGRKIIVATNVAETSITIDGVTAVVDSGLARIHRFDVNRAINALRVEPISRASADQRAGRAGRTQPGVCLRLWTEKDHAGRAPHDTPEVLRVELSEALLTLKSMKRGKGEPFMWLSQPGEDASVGAEALLRELGATDEQSELTERGRKMSAFPVHPRLSRMLMEASRTGCLARALTWAALISEREIMQRYEARIINRFLDPDEPESDLLVRERIWEEAERAKFDGRMCESLGVNAVACMEVQRTARQLAGVCRRLGMDVDARGESTLLIQSVIAGFRDHIAVRLDAQRPHAAMAGRRKVVMDRESVVRSPCVLVALDVREMGHRDAAQTVLSLASRVEVAWLEAVDPEGVSEERELRWNTETRAVEMVWSKRYRGLVVESGARATAPSVEASSILAEQIVSGALRLEKWDEAVEQWILRTRFAARLFPERQLMTYSEDDRAVIVHEIVGDAVRFSQLRDRAVSQIVKDALGYDDQRFVEKMAPESVNLPNGRRMRIEYAAEGMPRGRAKIQDLFDMNETPRIAGGRQAILLEILGPNQRPVQVTSDLAGFWTTLYPELKKELKRRYPRHEWR